MFEIAPFHPENLSSVLEFACELQDYERSIVSDLRAGSEIASAYVALLLRLVAECDGVMLLANAEKRPIGFACAWIETDDDMLAIQDTRTCAYVSDIFVNWRCSSADAAALRSGPRRSMSLRSNVTRRLAIAPMKLLLSNRLADLDRVDG